jgi:hypothetical protein
MPPGYVCTTEYEDGHKKSLCEKFDDHALLYFAGTGALLGLLAGGIEGMVTLAASFAFVFGMGYYTLKAVFITGRTIATWDTKRDGPMFAGGGLTEYDSTRARRTGEAAAQAMVRELRKYDQERRANRD